MVGRARMGAETPCRSVSCRSRGGGAPRGIHGARHSNVTLGTALNAAAAAGARETGSAKCPTGRGPS
jgi:hypothetical protein